MSYLWVAVGQAQARGRLRELADDSDKNWIATPKGRKRKKPDGTWQYDYSKPGTGKKAAVANKPTPKAGSKTVKKEQQETPADDAALKMQAHELADAAVLDRYGENSSPQAMAMYRRQYMGHLNKLRSAPQKAGSKTVKKEPAVSDAAGLAKDVEQAKPQPLQDRLKKAADAIPRDDKSVPIQDRSGADRLNQAAAILSGRLSVGNAVGILKDLVGYEGTFTSQENRELAGEAILALYEAMPIEDRDRLPGLLSGHIQGHSLGDRIHQGLADMLSRDYGNQKLASYGPLSKKTIKELLA